MRVNRIHLFFYRMMLFYPIQIRSKLDQIFGIFLENEILDFNVDFVVDIRVMLMNSSNILPKNIEWTYVLFARDIPWREKTVLLGCDFGFSK